MDTRSVNPISIAAVPVGKYLRALQDPWASEGFVSEGKAGDSVQLLLPGAGGDSLSTSPGTGRIPPFPAFRSRG